MEENKDKKKKNRIQRALYLRTKWEQAAWEMGDAGGLRTQQAFS